MQKQKRRRRRSSVAIWPTPVCSSGLPDVNTATPPSCTPLRKRCSTRSSVTGTWQHNSSTCLQRQLSRGGQDDRSCPRPRAVRFELLDQRDDKGGRLACNREGSSSRGGESWKLVNGRRIGNGSCSEEQDGSAQALVRCKTTTQRALPEPVRAMPTTSRPCKEGGHCDLVSASTATLPDGA